MKGVGEISGYTERENVLGEYLANLETVGILICWSWFELVLNEKGGMRQAFFLKDFPVCISFLKCVLSTSEIL